MDKKKSIKITYPMPMTLMGIFSRTQMAMEMEIGPLMIWTNGEESKGSATETAELKVTPMTEWEMSPAPRIQTEVTSPIGTAVREKSARVSFIINVCCGNEIKH